MPQRNNLKKAYAKHYDSLAPQSRYKLQTGFINSLATDNLTGKFLLYGGADSSIGIFDLSKSTTQPEARVEPKTAHQFGVSKVAWWWDDNGMFLSSSFDNTLALWDTDAMDPVYTFNLAQKVYNFDINREGVIATALDHPYIKLLDTRSGSESHVLKGHQGKVLSCKWNPLKDNLLASCGSDCTVKIWDVRQSQPLVECLDMNRTLERTKLEPLEFRKSHRASINGLQWFPWGDRLVSVGNDNKARVWNLNIEGGLNEGLNFGPLVQNKFLQNNDPCISPLRHKIPLQLFLNVDSGVVLRYELESAKLLRRQVPLAGANSSRQACTIARNIAGVEYFSGDGEGTITEWSKRAMTKEEVEAMLKGANEVEERVDDSGRGPATLGDFL